MASNNNAVIISASISKITSNSFYITATSNANCDSWDYSINNGTTWVNYSSRNTTSTTKTVTGLVPNTTYNVKIRARRTSDHAIFAMGTAVSAKTLGGAKLNSVQTFFADSSNPQIIMNCTVYNSSYKHTLSVKNGNTTIFTISNISISSGTVNKSIQLTSAQSTLLLNAMSNAKSITATYTLKTYSESTQIGSDSTCTGTISTTESVSKPTFTAFLYSDIYSPSIALTGDEHILVQGKSQLRVVCTAATPKNGAVISKYTATIGSATKESTTTTINFGAVDTSGDLILTVAAVDSRGYSTKVTANVSVISYEPPSINDWLIRRTNDVEETAQLEFYGRYSIVEINGITKNAINTVTYEYKERGSTEDYSEPISIIDDTTISSGSISYDNDAFAVFDEKKSFSIIVTVSDALSTSRQLMTLDAGTPLVTFRARKVGVLQNNPQRELDVEGIIGMNGYNIMGYCGEADNLNNLFEPGYYKVTSSTTGRPQSKTGFVEVFPKHGTYTVQRMISVDNVSADIYVRRMTSNTQGSWYHISSTEVT